MMRPASKIFKGESEYMTTAQICIILSIGIYLIAMIGIGLFFNREIGRAHV